MTEAALKEDGRAKIVDLVRKFQRHEAENLRSSYNETQARTDFITPLLEAFGWDVHNTAAQPRSLREVIEEATVEVVDEPVSKKPDYELRLARQRKLFVEAKKPSVNIETSRSAAFQARRYGFSASLPIVVLTNFHRLAIYDCLPSPLDTDEARVARTHLVRYDEYEARFDELWSLFSRNAVYSGEFDRRFAVDVTRRGADQFDDYFLRQVRSWRERLASDINANTPGLTPAELTYAVQLFLSRIVFLRICEDRDIERYETLKNLPAANKFLALMAELRRADAFYDSGLFRLLDDARLGIKITDHVLQGIIIELYYPQSSYTFAVVETEVLGEIYEQFLGEVITINGSFVEIVSKPEIREEAYPVGSGAHIFCGRVMERQRFGAWILRSSGGRLAWSSAAPTVFAGSGHFGVAARASAFCAKLLRHPGLGAKYALQYGWDIDVSVELWPMKSQAGWADFDVSEAFWRSVGKSFRQLSGEGELNTGIQIDDNPGFAAIVPSGNRVTGGPQVCHSLFGLFEFKFRLRHGSCSILGKGC